MQHPQNFASQSKSKSQGVFMPLKENQTQQQGVPAQQSQQPQQQQQHPQQQQQHQPPVAQNLQQQNSTPSRIPYRTTLQHQGTPDSSNIVQVRSSSTEQGIRGSNQISHFSLQQDSAKKSNLFKQMPQQSPANVNVVRGPEYALQEKLEEKIELLLQENKRLNDLLLVKHQENQTLKQSSLVNTNQDLKAFEQRVDRLQHVIQQQQQEIETLTKQCQEYDSQGDQFKK